MGAKRYALVGTGNRGLGMFARPLAADFPQAAEPCEFEAKDPQAAVSIIDRRRVIGVLKVLRDRLAT